MKLDIEMDQEEFDEATKDFEERILNGNYMGADFKVTVFGHKYQDGVVLTGVYATDGTSIPLPEGKHRYENDDDAEHAGMLIFRASLA